MASFIKNLLLTSKEQPLVFNIADKTYNQFVNMLTVEKIYELSDNLKIFEILGHVPHKKFIQTMTEVFDGSQLFLQLYEQIFQRFKSLKCKLRNEKGGYFLTKIISSGDEIKAYEICCALGSFMKCDYKDKIKLFFDLTDIDEDGLCNEKEIVRLMTTLNFVFSEEESTLATNSTILTQSLAQIKTNETLHKLMYFPGELKRILKVERYINFPTFYNALTQIPDYKYSIIPCFVNFKKALNSKKFEKDIQVYLPVKDDFFKISNDVLGSSKITTGGNPMFETETKFPIVKRNNIKQMMKRESKCWKIRGKKRLASNGRGVGLFKTSIRDILMKNISGYEKTSYFVNYNKIRNLEVHPSVIEVVGNKPNRSEDIAYSKTERNLKYIFPSKFMSLQDTIKEIETISNKHKLDNQIEQKVIQLGKTIREEANEMKVRCGSRNKNQKTLVFGRFTDMQVKID